MGLSLVLLPMFGLSHGFSHKPLERAILMVSLAVVLVVTSSFYPLSILEYSGYALAILGLCIYFYFINTIYKTRARKEIDIYAKSLMFSYFSLIASLVLAVLYFFFDTQELLLTSGWMMFFGFFAFVVTGHVYKIIPFLVWFERFSPLVGKQRVPMLADMVPKQSSSAQLIFSAVGVVVIAVAILLQDDKLIKAGASFLLIGALAFVRNVFFMINYK